MSARISQLQPVPARDTAPACGRAQPGRGSRSGEGRRTRARRRRCPRNRVRHPAHTAVATSSRRVPYRTPEARTRSRGVRGQAQSRVAVQPPRRAEARAGVRGTGPAPRPDRGARPPCFFAPARRRGSPRRQVPIALRFASPRGANASDNSPRARPRLRGRRARRDEPAARVPAASRRGRYAR